MRKVRAETGQLDNDAHSVGGFVTGLWDMWLWMGRCDGTLKIAMCYVDFCYALCRKYGMVAAFGCGF